MEEICQVARCTGHCCRRFPLSLGSPMQCVAAALRNTLRPGNQHWLINHLVHLGEEIYDPGPGRIPWERDYYTCELLEPGGGCGDYENRPAVCRNHPVRGDHRNECPAGCTRMATYAEGLTWHLKWCPDEEVEAICSET